MKSIKQQQAQDLFLHTANTREQIADILDLNRKTIYLWVKNGKWQEMKKAAEQTPGMMRMKLYNFMESITRKVESREDQCPTPQEVNMLQKLMKMDGTIEGNRMGSYIQAFEELLRFICAKDLALGKQVVTIADQFVRGNFGDFHTQLQKQSAEHIDEITKNLENLDKEIIPELPREEKHIALSDLQSESTWVGICNPSASQIQPTAPPETPCYQERNEAPVGQSEAQTGENGAFSISPENAMKPNTEATDRNINNAKNAPSEINTGNETLPNPETSANGSSLPNCQIVELSNSLSLPNCQIVELSNSLSLPNCQIVELPNSPSLPNSLASLTEKISAVDLTYVAPFQVEFNGMWTEENSSSLPAVSGIYCVYEARHDKIHNLTNPLKLLAIGESADIRAAVAALLPVSGWQTATKEDTTLCFSYAAVAPENRHRIAGALIHHHKPLFNTTYKNEYPFGDALVRTYGQSTFLSKSFKISKQQIKPRPDNNEALPG